MIANNKLIWKSMTKMIISFKPIINKALTK